MWNRMLALSVLLVMALSLTAWAADPQTKTGTIKSVDVNAKTFVMSRDPQPLTFTVDDKTAITLDGKDSSFDKAIKQDLKVSVSYTRAGETRLAVKVDVTSAVPAK